MKVIDLFSGCGGLSLGFLQNQFEVVKAVEFDESIANTYQLNHPNIEMMVDDIRNIDNSDNFNEGDADIVIGGPPCQGFSMAGSRIREGFIDDERNYLFKHYLNIVRTVKPKIFIMENVKGLKTMQGGKIFDQICQIFADEQAMDGTKYHIYHKVLKAVDLGIPQKRERLFIIGIKDNPIDFESKLETTKQHIISKHPTFFNPVTIRQAIDNLPAATSDGIIDNPTPVSEYQVYLSTRDDKLHNHIRTNHSKIAIERMQKIANGNNFTSLNEDIKSVHSGSYGRLNWDDVAPTITTRFDTPSGGRFIHPVEHRTLTPREAARIQSFPDDFIFHGNKTSVCKQIGNAVPPKMSYFWANFVESILRDKNII